MTNKVYKKLICYQDVERTPSISVFAIRHFFNIELDNGESIMINLIINGYKYRVELQKRNTRNEYRFFLNRIRDYINYDVDDILIFSYDNENFVLKIVKKNQASESNYRYTSELHSMNGKLHCIG